MPDLSAWETRLIREWRILHDSVGESRGKKTKGSSRKAGQKGIEDQEVRDFGSVRVSDRNGSLNPQELALAAEDLLQLQRGLTGERSLIGSAYMEEIRGLGAYLLFYWFTSYAQTWGILEMANRAMAAQSAVFPTFQAGNDSIKGSQLRILDLGSGPAPCGLAIADWFRSYGQYQHKTQYEIEITACDQSHLALQVAQNLAGTAQYALNIIARWRAGRDPIPDGSYHYIVLGHLLNELWKQAEDRLEKREALLEGLKRSLAPGGILVILEPALLGTGRDLLHLRDRLLDTGWQVLAPCFNRLPCPALAQPNQTCHSDFEWDPPRTVRDLVRRTGMDKDLVKTTALVLSRGSGEPEAIRAAENGNRSRLYRVVSEPMLNKAGRTRLIICGTEGRIPFSAKLGEGFPSEAVFKKLRRSDAIILNRPKQRETGLAVGPETEITLFS